MTPTLKEIMEYDDVPKKDGEFVRELYEKASEAVQKRMNQELADLLNERGFRGTYVHDHGADYEKDRYVIRRGKLDLDDKQLLAYMDSPEYEDAIRGGKAGMPDYFMGDVAVFNFNKSVEIQKKYAKYLLKKIGAAEGPIELATVFRVWACPCCQHTNSMDWGACDKCGSIVVEKQQCPEVSKVRAAKDHKEIFRVEGIPPSFVKIQDLVRDTI